MMPIHMTVQVVFVVLSIFLFAAPSSAITIRYALIVGNNDGVDNDGTQPFPPLQHAEREAMRLRDKLVEFSQFDSSESRTRVLTSATRTDVQLAIQSLRRRREADLKLLGKVDTLFLFYFTGHGLEGKLLLRDGPLSGDEIGTIFSEMNADFSIGVFDSCFSGSLDKTTLLAKGIRPAPGLNLFNELPEEVLSAEGRIWYVSSGSNQESFEDERLGGVFTHFFIKALEQAEVSGPGITLENIWQYARSHTVEYTARRKKNQIPEQYISNLRSNAPIYFSFLSRRSASLELSETLSGKFALAYKTGNYTQIFEKKTGNKKTLPVYPGIARLIFTNRDNQVATRTVTLKAGEKLILRTMHDIAPLPAPGEHYEPLMEKGAGADLNFAAMRVKAGLSLLTGIGYSYGLENSRILFSRNNVFLPLRFDIGHLFVSTQFQYGYDSREYPAWRHQVHETGARVGAGYAFILPRSRLGVGAAFGGAYMIQIYDDGQRRSCGRYRPLIETNLLFNISRLVHMAIIADMGGSYSCGVGADSSNIWRLSASMETALYFRLN